MRGEKVIGTVAVQGFVEYGTFQFSFRLCFVLPHVLWYDRIGFVDVFLVEQPFTRSL